MKKEFKLVVATNNDHKIKEYQDMFSPFGISIISPKELSITSDPEENGNTYEENSLIKARAVAKYTSLPVMADDSGLSINALNGFPGIHSARFAKEEGGNKAANIKIIDMLKPYEDKSASFNCVITLLNVEKVPLQFKGICDGYILDKPIGENGFGYDPIFFSNKANEPFGIASEEIKNEYSHRGLAFKKLISYLKTNNFIE